MIAWHQHWDAWDIAGIAVCLVFISLYVLHVVSKAVLNYHWKRMVNLHYWPKDPISKPKPRLVVIFMYLRHLVSKAVRNLRGKRMTRQWPTHGGHSEHFFQGPREVPKE